MKFRLLIQPKNIDWTIFCFLLFSHLPNAFYSIFLLFLVFALRIAFSFKLSLPKSWKMIEFFWTLIGLIMMFSFFTHFSSFNNLFWGVICFLPIVLIPFLLPFRKYRYHQSSYRLINAVKLFTFVEIIVMIVQFVKLAFQFKTIDIFTATNGAAGDLITGTVGFSSVISVTLGYISIVFLNYYLNYKYKRDAIWFLISFIGMILPAYTAGTFVYVLSFVLFLLGRFIVDIFKSGIINKRTGILIALLIVSICIIVYSQMSNILYAQRIISFVFFDPPNKIKAISSTFEYSKENVWDIPLGVGFGNYSSRAAFITSGEYLANQPKFIPVTRSKYFEKYMFPLFNKESQNKIISSSFGNSMINAPFNQFQTVYGEGGLISLSILCILLAFVFKIKVPYSNNLHRLGLIYLILLMFCDNWLSYPSFCFIFWLLLLDIYTYVPMKQVRRVIIPFNMDRRVDSRYEY
jgi:hypothetical protein